jgi:integrase/recombinase XerC
VKNEFLQHIEKEKRQSQHTLTAYSSDLNQFENYLLNIFHITDLTKVNHQNVRSWLVSLIECGISPISVRRKISSLNAFFKYLQRNKIMESNPMLKISPPKTGQKLPAFLSEKQMKNVLWQDKNDNSFESIRNQFIVELFYSTGIRLAELIEIAIDDIDYAQKIIRINGKGNKQRIIPIFERMAFSIKNYLHHRDKFITENTINSKWLIITSKGKKAYPKLVYRIVKSSMLTATTHHKKSPHVLRHTFATTMLNRGAGLNTIKDSLGHANLSATQIYTHNSIEKLQTIYKQAHPRAKS